MMFSVRLVLADHYMSPPIHELDVSYSEFRGTEVEQVPVIRIFGSTVTGKKTCLHVHGVFPYMYIPFEGSGAHDRLMYQIASSLDKALNISLGKANATVQHVFKMTLVSGLPFYGFHTKEHQYFKIYFYNPLMVKKAAELLQSGAILNKIYQPHEAHLPYILQFMIDYNLYGMNHVNLKNVKFRRDPENPGSFECLSEEILLPERVSRLSTCETEADAMAADIINRTAVSDQLALNPGLAAIWEDEKQRRREGGRTSQITPQSSRERPFAASTDSALFFKQKLHEKLLLLNSQLSNNSSTLLDTPEVTKTPYPAETSEDSELLEASFVDLHIQSSGSSPFIRSGQMEQDDNASFVDEDLVLSLLSSQRRATHNSVWMDSQDEELTAVLHNLENIADIDEDSILGSQICQELQDEEIHGCDDEDMQDFSEPLDAVLDCYTDDYHQKENVKRSLSLATEQNMVYNEENCQLDISHKLNISRSESSKSLESDNTSVKSMCSCPIRSEARKDDGSQLCACPQRRHGACNRGVNVPTLHCAENMEQLLAESSGDTVSKTVRKQPKSPFLGSHIENGLYLSTQENDCKNISQGSVKVYANGERTSRNSASVIVDFPERKRIVKQRKILDMFVAEDDMSSKALSPRMTVKEGSFLCEGLTEQKLHNSNSLYITQMPEINSYERNETLKTSSLDSDSDGVRSRHTEKVEQHTEDWCNFNDEEELEEGILSYYNETISYSATASAEFEEFMVKPPVPANNSSKHEMNLECALFMRMEQNSLGNVAETHNVINQTPLTEHLCRNESHFRIVTTAHKNFRVYIPRFNPPSKNEILASLSEFCIPEYRHQEPFVGNVLDIGNKIEVGSKVLKICSMSVCDLQPFAGSLQDILDIETWRRKLLQELSYTSQGSLDQSSDFGLDNMKPALASNREVVITPCKLPPSITEVNLWPKAAQKSNVQELQGNDVGDDVSSRRIMMPLSPGQESGSDDMSFLPVTPGSLRSEQNGRGNVTTTHSTPQVTLASAYLPSPSCTPIHNSSQNRTKMLLKRSRKGLKFDPQTQENVSFMLPSIREEPEEAAVDTILKCGAAKENPISSDSSELPHFCDNSGPYKHQDSDGRSEVIRSVEQVQPENAIDLISSSQGTVEAEPVRKLLLHHQLHPVTTTQRAVEGVNSSCQIEESTPNNTYGFQVSLQNLHEVKAICEYQFLTMFIMELHIHTRGDLKPDPSYDPIRALFYMVVNDIPEDAGLSKHELAVIVVYTLDGDVKIPLLNMNENCKVTYVEDEASLVHELVKCVKKWDPDILGGYEVEMLSWGYLFQRAYTLQINLGPLVSRVPTASHQHTGNESATSNFHEEIRLTGRIMLNIWRLMRHEVALQSYTFENVVFHVLHQRIPLHSFKHLTNCWEHRMHLYRWMCVEYYLLRVQGIFKLLDQLDLIGHTSELARLFGIQFLEVLSRGSQFRVESMMLRLAKPINYVPVSPSIQQRARMRAPESLPLILEPVSRFYSDPVIVLDFQSLYPSVIIAYNYCFSTCLGKVEHLGQATPFLFGCTQLKVPPAHLVKLESSINISPCGVAFVNDGIRKGILPQMLQEILDTRLMVKQSMKRHKSNKALQRVLHSRQLGLKLIANVTYGYTAANFSGRMPCSEIGDSVVSKARETLERAIHLVEATPRWGAHVVYGDTDSLFVLVPGKSREQAFKIGAEIAEAVTLDNPKPVKLKLEKVYQPCILQTKKRYVGYMYESPDQEKPVYDAKGIETVRRDGCPAVAKILEKSLRLVFETKDVSLVKSYVCQQFTKLLQGRINMQDLIFAREYRGMSGYRPGACVPALELARRWLQTDRRAEPRQRERVPYVIVNGPPGLPLIRLVRSPLDLLADPSLRPNATYYITRVIIPPLDRCFSLLGAEVESWYADMPRKCVTNLPTAPPSGLKKCTISQYFITMNCTVCNQPTDSGICLNCQQQTQHVAVVLANKIRIWERTYTNITKVCQSCCGRPEAIDCISLDCPILFRRNQSTRDLQQASFIQNLRDQYLTF